MKTQITIINEQNGREFSVQSCNHGVHYSHVQEERAKELIDSIIYAKRLQEAMMPTEEEINGMVGEHFILNKPKDIVGGDFYFVEPIKMTGKNIIAIAVADCTGHGVPGAFLSMSGYGILKNSLSEKKVNSPSEALEYLNSGISKVFRTASTLDKIRDGMDIALCVVDMDTKVLEFAGANNKAIIIRKDKSVIELIPARRPIGFDERNTPFNTQKFQLQEGDMLYLFSDGYKDQFGGSDGKKLGYKGLLRNLLETSHEGCKEQKQFLIDLFEDWRGDIDQVDDVLVFGIRI